MAARANSRPAEKPAAHNGLRANEPASRHGQVPIPQGGGKHYPSKRPVAEEGEVFD